MNTNENNQPKIDANGELYEDSMPINAPTRLRDHSGYRVSPFVYEHGFFNGVLEVEGEEFYEFIHSSDQKKMAYVRLKWIKSAIEEIRNKISEVKLKSIELISIISTTKYRVPLLEKEIEELQYEKEKIDTLKNSLKNEKDDINPYYSTFIAWCFIGCALVFIIAEISVTQDVFHNVLNIHPIHSYIVAIAVALSSFAIKPAIDRFFEEPFLSGFNKKRVVWLLIIFSLLLLCSLGILGYYRNIAIVMQTKIEIDNSTPMEEWLKLLSAPSIQIFYTLFSIILALAGAICFSIGIPVFKLVAKRKSIEGEIEKKEKTYISLTDQISLKRNEKVKVTTDGEISEKQLSQLENPQTLQMNLEGLLKEELMAWETMFENQTKAEISWYEEGRKRGNKYTLADELIISLYDFPNGGYKQSENKSKEEGHPSPSVNGKYLHEKVRSLIDYNLNRKPKLNGHHE